MHFFKFSALLFMLFTSQPVLSQDAADLPEGIMATRGDGSVSRGIFEASLAGISEKDRAAIVRSGRRVESRIDDLLMNYRLI